MKYPNRAVGHVSYLDSFALSPKVEGLRPHTISCYVREVRRLGERTDWIGPANIKTDHIRSYIDWLSGPVKPKTVAAAQLGLRRYFRFLIDEKEIEQDPSACIKLVRFRTDPQPTYTNYEIQKLISACDQSTQNGVRDQAMITVLFDTGVRVGELVSRGIPDWSNRVVQVDGKTGVRQVPSPVFPIRFRKLS